MAYAYGNFGNWFTDTIAAIAPANTIVGRAARGDWAGAGQSTVNLVGTAAQARSVKTPAAAPPPQSGIGAAFAPGGFVEKNQTTLLVIAAGLGVFLLMGKRR